MKIVIDIDENVFTRLFDNGIQDNEIATDDICEMARALRLGTPLPEPYKKNNEFFNFDASMVKNSEDAISRQALIEKATSWDKHFADSERCVSLTDIQNAPSVTPKAEQKGCYYEK